MSLDLMPRTHYATGFLDNQTHTSLKDFFLTEAETFEPGRVSSKDFLDGQVNEETRICRVTALPKTLKSAFREAVSAALPDLTQKVGLQMPKSWKLEINAAIYPDGGFFNRHIDTTSGVGSCPMEDTARLMSCVYYLCRQPKSFTGGALRLHPFAGAGFVDYEPEDNSLVVFPSFAPHEVLPISVPSGRLADSRFSINCWVRIPKPAQAE